MNHEHIIKRVNLSVNDMGEQPMIYHGDHNEFYTQDKTPINKPMYLVFEFCSECDFGTINGERINKNAIPDLNVFTYIEKPLSVFQWSMQHQEFEALKRDIQKAIDEANEKEVIL